MQDPVFVERILGKGAEAKQIVQVEFSNLSEAQLNWKPRPESWSIAQCLDHLLISDGLYFDDLEKIGNGTYQMSFWEKYSPFTRMFGKMFRNSLSVKVKKKMKAPGKLRPTASTLKKDIIQHYDQNLEKFLGYISKCRNADLDKLKLNSPLIGIFTYSLRDAMQFLMQHEHRHILQATRVKSNDEFPKNN